ncbi:MAG: SGNH/GDSL hydrolase family protein, partial [Ruminiclostridium sp.]|nr:SGNH/GDSL hydrolase family protein [Ruminiclostridium sp.]
ITEGMQWSWYVFEHLGFASHCNTAVGGAVWCKRTFDTSAGKVSSQDYASPGFAGISGGWEPTADPAELQRRVNNCAPVHIAGYLDKIKKGEAFPPDIFVFALGTNDQEETYGSAEEALASEEPDLYTSAGAMCACIRSISDSFPSCEVFVLTPIQTASREHNRKIERMISDIFVPITSALGVRLIDCFHNCIINEVNEREFGEGLFLKDGLHPNSSGILQQGKFITREILKVIG